MDSSVLRVIAVDWSGDKSGGAKTIWLAEATQGQIVRLEPGRTRNQIVEELTGLCSADSRVVVGLDFAFSMPGWFVESQGASSGPDFWNVVALKGEAWLRECPQPFWGRAGTRKPTDRELLRQTERDAVLSGGTSPSSVFLIAGGSQVGTGSLRGMPYLGDLYRNGWQIWPFHAPGSRTVIEIYPRQLTGAVVKKSPSSCREYLERRFPDLDPQWAILAASNDNAFDAAVSALVMDKHRELLVTLPDLSNDPVVRLEGRIWSPHLFGETTP